MMAVSIQQGEQSPGDVYISLIPMCILLLGYGLIEKISPIR